ncbi:MAG: helix-turn-helix transcriptional regulator [Spirochaetales bacterium]|nr:helix-turn-helix transcriptional regulator [Spirochaetales bacterium]
MDDRLLVLEMIAYIEKHLCDDTETRDLVDYSGYSLNRLRQKFFAVTGETPSAYVRKRKLTEAAKEILDGNQIIDVCLKYGFSTQENFTTSFRSYFGVTPKEIYVMDKKYRNFIRKLREVYNIMEISGLKQPPLCTTLLGCMKGAADYFDLDLSVPMLFGLSGHAFLVNIHDELCPSGPYAWNKEGFFNNLRNLGIDIGPTWFLGKDSDQRERQKAEQDVIDALNNGSLGILEFLEYQLVGGYDEDGFVFLAPWNWESGVEQKRLTFSSWKECYDREGFAGFMIAGKGKVNGDFTAMLKQSLGLGLEFLREPEKYQCPKYSIGYRAWDNWIENVREGRATGQGNRWNGMVWMECRTQGAAFFAEAAEMLEEEEMQTACLELEKIYTKQGNNLDKIKEAELGQKQKISLLEENGKLDRLAEEQMDRLYSLL